MASDDFALATADAPAGAPRRLIRRALERVDSYYRERFELLPIGPLLYLGLERHEGAACPLYDGTRLETGGWIGRLHFNNAQAANLQASSRLQAGVRFARLLRDSLNELADRARHDARMREVAVYEGITWLREHGAAVGFEAQPLPSGFRRWLLERISGCSSGRSHLRLAPLPWRTSCRVASASHVRH